MIKKNMLKNILFKYIVLAWFGFMFIFSALNIGVVLANVEKINIVNASIIDKSSTTEASINSFDKDKITTSTKYHNVNDYVEFKITLKNTDSKKYTIKTITDNNSDNYILYEYDKHENEVLLPDSEKDFIIKATYKNEVTDISNRNANDNVEFKITFIEEDGSETDKVVPINPITGDNLYIYITLGAISLLGLLFTLKYKKITKTLLILLLMTPFLVKAASLTYDFRIISDIGYYDKVVVTIDRNGTKETMIVPYGTKITAPTAPTITGYNFVGFFIDGNPADFNNSITEDTEIEVRYNIINYNITYDLAGGTPTGSNPTTYTVEDSFTLSNPKLTGYNFSGWTGTGLSGLTPTVTINKGTTGPLSYTANFSAATNTKYKVFHKYQQVTGDLYDTEEENGTGTTGSIIYPQVKSRTGFIDPTVQSLEILPDGSASVEYIYTRVPCQFEADSNTNSSLANGTYRYGTVITASPKNIPGYTFASWEDGSTSNSRTITLTGDVSISTSYTANTNTPYTVTHRYQKVTLDGYEEETITGYGTTDTTIVAPIQTRTGFTTPASANVTIYGDGSGSATYTYDRVMFNFTVTDRTFITPESAANGSYPYGAQVSVTAINAPGYDFEWLDGDTNYTRTFTIDSDVTITPKYTARSDTPYVVYHYTQKLDGTYELKETEFLFGTTGTSVTPTAKTYEGFTIVATDTKTIAGTGDTEFNYYYTRDKHTLTILHPEDVVEGDVSGQYYYLQQIELTAKEKAGYTFTGWSTGGTSSSITVTMGINDITIGPQYTAHTNTPYTVTHRYQKVTLDGYDEETVTGYGTTDTTIAAPLQLRTGFTTPASANVTIYGDGSGSATYTYDRVMFNFTVTDRTFLTPESAANGSYPYGAQVSVTATEVPGYNFAWLDGDTNYTRTFTIDSDVTLTPQYTMITYEVTFDENGGSAVSDMTISWHTTFAASGGLPSTSKADHTFAGWFTDDSFTTEVTNYTVVTADMELVAKFIPNNAVAELNNNEFYTTVQAAVDAAPNDEQSTIKILQDVTTGSDMVFNMYTTTVDKDIILDLNNHTIKSTNNYAVRSRGNLTIKNGTVIGSGNKKSTIESNTGTLILDNVRVENTYNRQALYIKNQPTENGTNPSSLGAPVVEIRGNSYFESKAPDARGTIHIVSGTLDIKSATVVSTTGYGLYVESSSAVVNIGTSDGAYDTTTPVIKGLTYGASVKSGTSAKYSVYDGTLMGKTAAVENVNDILNSETGSTIATGTDGDYYTLYYQMP